MIMKIYTVIWILMGVGLLAYWIYSRKKKNKE